MGNPSDGFNGKTISLSIANFWAEVTIVESEQLVSIGSYSTQDLYVIVDTVDTVVTNSTHEWNFIWYKCMCEVLDINIPQPNKWLYTTIIL